MPVDRRSKESTLKSKDAGPFIATVVSHLDPKGMGTLQVQVEKAVGGDREETSQLTTCRYLSPFYGVTDFRHNGSNNEYGDTQKSYGMWFIPPDVGTKVLVIFANGDPTKAFWIGCIQDEYMNHMIPGIAASSFHVDGKATKVPVAEYNKKLYDGTQVDTTKIAKPSHPMQDVLLEQGLLEDETRGITTSSARREVPSMVFGISTPGPKDKKGKRGRIGKAGNKVSTAFVSRLGGSTFVMDDGDDKFIRKTPASEGPYEYVAVEAGEKGGEVNIPHNELIRLRTRTGHQILLHNSEDLIYIANARGTSWIEMTSNGKIDIFAEDSVSIHTQTDFNFKADRDVNIEAGNNVNITAANNIFQTATGANFEVVAGADGKITVAGQSNIKAGGDHVETAANIHMNGPAAAEATAAKVPKRVPEHEPWPYHENLGPALYTPEMTDSAVDTPLEPGEQISTVDTFRKVPPTEG